MKFSLDTEKVENIKLTITDNEKESLVDAVQELCFGISSFIMDFMMQWGIDTEEKATSFKDVCTSCINRNLDTMVEEIISVPVDDDLENDIKSLTEQLEGAVFSDAEIKNIVAIVHKKGSIEAAMDFLVDVGKENGIDFV